VPNHWTKINDEADAKPGDELYVDEQSGAIYVRGTAPGNTTKEAVAPLARAARSSHDQGSARAVMLEEDRCRSTGSVSPPARLIR
jgi:hypothetical protein